jgi:hypothetical protein
MEHSRKLVNTLEDKNDLASKISNDASKCFELSDMYDDMISTGGYISSESFAQF